MITEINYYLSKKYLSKFGIQHIDFTNFKKRDSSLRSE